MEKCICGISGKDGITKTRLPGATTGMQSTTILNRVEDYKSFVYWKVVLLEDGAVRSLPIHSKRFAPDLPERSLLAFRQSNDIILFLHEHLLVLRQNGENQDPGQSQNQAVTKH